MTQSVGAAKLTSISKEREVDTLPHGPAHGELKQFHALWRRNWLVMVSGFWRSADKRHESCRRRWAGQRWCVIETVCGNRHWLLHRLVVRVRDDRER